MIADLAELRKLSGLKRRSDVRRWLEAHGIAFMVQPSGDPVSTLEAINIAMHGHSRFNKPDFSKYPGARPRVTKNRVVRLSEPPR